jgi:hypothetical protein
MTVTRQQLFETPINTVDAAHKWIEDLVALDLDFHFDDPPETIEYGLTGRRVFTDAEVPLVNARINELFGFDFDPFDDLVRLTNPGSDSED